MVFRSDLRKILSLSYLGGLGKLVHVFSKAKYRKKNEMSLRLENHANEPTW